MSPHDLLERLIDYARAGGSLMIPLLLLSVVMWALSIAKTIRLLRLRRREASPRECLALFRTGGDACAALAPWQRDILTRYMTERCGDPELNRKALEAILARQTFGTMRHVGAILLLAAVAPLLGLLGTVSGMITTFDVIAQFGTGNARALASGISEALITTQSGLVAAVPGLLLGVLLLRRAERLKARMTLFRIGLQQATDGADTARESA